MNQEIKDLKPEFDDVKNLYKAKNKKFLPWFISLLVVFIVMISVQLAGIIHGLILKNNYISNIHSLLEKGGLDVAEKAYKSLIITAMFYLVILFIITIWYIFSFSKCVKNKDYSLFSSILLFVIPFIFFVIMINFIFNWGQILNLKTWNVIQITSLTNSIIFIIAYPIIFRNIKKTITMFYKIKAYNQIQNNGMFNELFNTFNQSQNQQNNGTVNNTEVNGTILNQHNEDIKNNSKSNKFDYYKNSLQTLEKDNLLLMAKKLNIYNPEAFTREQLIDKIALLFSETSSQIKPNDNDDSNKSNNDDEKPIQ